MTGSYKNYTEEVRRLVSWFFSISSVLQHTKLHFWVRQGSTRRSLRCGEMDMEILIVGIFSFRGDSPPDPPYKSIRYGCNMLLLILYSISGNVMKNHILCIDPFWSISNCFFPSILYHVLLLPFTFALINTFVRCVMISLVPLASPPVKLLVILLDTLQIGQDDVEVFRYS